MATYEEKKALRDDGWTYEQIADHFGISKQAVAQALAQDRNDYFRPLTRHAVVFDGLREWMNQNKVSISSMMRSLGYKLSGGDSLRFRLNGKCEIRK